MHDCFLLPWTVLCFCDGEPEDEFGRGGTEQERSERPRREIMNVERQKFYPVKKINIVMDCADAGILADFYSRLLGWEWTHPRVDGWAAVTSPEGTVIAFQEVENYEPPVWPWQPGRQGQMIHLDIWVDDLDEGVKHALACGAKESKTQYFTTSKTFFDPAGHPFCIDTDGEEAP